MKAFLFVFALCLALFAYCEAVDFCCTPNQWTSNNANWDPQREFFAFGVQAYDYTNMREYFTAIEMEGADRVNATYILNWATSTGYRIFSYFGGDRCRKFPLTPPMPQYCIPNSAVYRGNFTIGGSLLVNSFEFISGQNDLKGYLEVSATGCLPIRNIGMFMGRNPNLDEENFFNVVMTVNPNLFTPPAFCG